MTHVCICENVQLNTELTNERIMHGSMDNLQTR